MLLGVLSSRRPGDRSRSLSRDAAGQQRVGVEQQAVQNGRTSRRGRAATAGHSGSNPFEIFQAGKSPREGFHLVDTFHAEADIRNPGAAAAATTTTTTTTTTAATTTAATTATTAAAATTTTAANSVDPDLPVVDECLAIAAHNVGFVRLVSSVTSVVGDDDDVNNALDRNSAEELAAQVVAERKLLQFRQRTRW